MPASDGPLLWYLNRGTGMVLLVLFTLSVVLGVLSTGNRAGGRLPAFVSQAVHRNIALLSATLLVAHIITAVVDTFVDIRWWQALLPWWGSTYQPLWLGLGTLAFDLIVAVTITGLVRDRMSHRTWRLVHVLAYPAWAISVAHGVGIGTDTTEAWAWGLAAGCVLAVLVAVGIRLGRLAISDALVQVEP